VATSGMVRCGFSISLEVLGIVSGKKWNGQWPKLEGSQRDVPVLAAPIPEAIDPRLGFLNPCCLGVGNFVTW
jgi:hypothetical protein